MAAAMFMDAIARLPGNSGENSGAIGAYTQTELASTEELMQNRKKGETRKQE